jgi:hypothetical protein
VSIIATFTVHCDDCGEAIDDGDVRGRRSTRRGARLVAGQHDYKRRRLNDGLMHDLCYDCDSRRGAAFDGVIRRGKYNRAPPSTPGDKDPGK